MKKNNENGLELDKGIDVRAAFISSAVVASVIGLIGTCNAAYKFGTVEELSCVTIERVENVIDGGNSKYLVFTQDNGVFENSDTFFYWKFDSIDFYSKLAKGGDFDMITYGYRVPFLSWYPNIVEATANPNCGE